MESLSLVPDMCCAGTYPHTQILSHLEAVVEAGLPRLAAVEADLQASSEADVLEPNPAPGTAPGCGELLRSCHHLQDADRWAVRFGLRFEVGCSHLTLVVGQGVSPTACQNAIMACLVSLVLPAGITARVF